MYQKKTAAFILAMLVFSLPLTACKEKTPDSKSSSKSNVSAPSSETLSETAEESGPEEVSSSADAVSKSSQAASSKGASVSSKDAINIIDDYSSDKLPKVDLKKFVLRVGVSSKSLLKYLYTGDEVKDHPINEVSTARYKVIDQIEKRFNCVIEPVYYEYGKTSEVFSASILSGAASVPHVILTSTWEAGYVMAGNLLTDFGQVKYIDASKPWWNASLAEASKIKGKTYLMSSELTNPSVRSWTVLYSKKIAREIGMTDAALTTLVNNKQWNWEKFAEFAKKAVKDTNGDGKLDDKDRWGFSAPGTDFTYAMMMSAGIDYMERVNGKWTYALNNDKAVSALERLNRIMTTDGIRYPVQNNTAQGEIFGKGGTLFHVSQVAQQLSIIREQGDAGLLPMPIGPGQSQYVSTIDHNAPCIMIPKTNKKLQETGLLLEALSFAQWKLLPEALEIYKDLYFDEGDKLTPNVFRDNYNYLTVMPSHFNETTAFVKSCRQPILVAVGTPNEDISGIVASIRNSSQAAIDQFFGQ